MSPVLPFEPSPTREALEPFFWIRNVDDRGNAVDQCFVDAAYQKVADFRRYRRNDLRDDAVRAEIVEQAVYRSSRAQKTEPVRDVPGYIFRTFMRLVDEHIGRENRLECHDAPKLDQLLQREGNSTVTDIETAIARREVLDAMDGETRWACTRRLCGYEVQEIAAELNISPDCLSTRLRRGIREAAEKLIRRGRMSDNSVAHGRRESTK
jgi:DNA-directed RNA polymerase specialized sigma24 family protein